METMSFRTDENTAFLERLQKRGGGDFLKELAEAVLARLMQRGERDRRGGFFAIRPRRSVVPVQR